MIEIPGYIIKQEIGHGGMAKVYLATHEGLQRDVAIKVMFKNLGKYFEYNERFIREARIVAQLSHRNIITVFDVGIHEDNHYIAMELLPGETLGDKIKTGLTSEYSLKLLKQICAGLQYAHDKKYIHRDIKPENILFREDETPVISDFGIARATESDTRMTAEGTVIGTAIYMSPEQAQGHPINNCADLYSLGIIFYEMLTGNVPYNADTSIAIAFKHIKNPIPTLKEEHKNLQPLLNKLLAKDPKQRYQSCNEIIHDIKTLGQIRKTSRATVLMSQGGHSTESIDLRPGPANRWKKITGVIGILIIATLAAAYTLIYLPQQQKQIEKKQNNIANIEQIRKADEFKRHSEEKQRLIEEEKLATEQVKQSKIKAEKLAVESTRLAAEKKAEEEKLEKIESLLTKAETILLKTRFNSLLGSADSKILKPQLFESHNNFMAVLKLDSRNKKAKTGIDQIAQQFLDMAEDEAGKSNFTKADFYIKSVIEIVPSYPNLTRSQQKINKLYIKDRSTKASTPDTIETPKNSRPNL